MSGKATLLQRLKQLKSALTAQLFDCDIALISDYLTPQEQKLFAQMDVVDQRHAVDVAFTALKLATPHQQINIKWLVKAALLHDIGKQRGDLTIFHRILLVTLDALCPKLLLKLASIQINQLKGEDIYIIKEISSKTAKIKAGNPWSRLRYACWLYFSHPTISSYLLKNQADTPPEIIEWVATHHQPPNNNDSLELTILRNADSLN